MLTDLSPDKEQTGLFLYWLNYWWWLRNQSTKMMTFKVRNVLLPLPHEPGEAVSAYCIQCLPLKYRDCSPELPCKITNKNMCSY